MQSNDRNRCWLFCFLLLAAIGEADAFHIDNYGPTTTGTHKVSSDKNQEGSNFQFNFQEHDTAVTITPQNENTVLLQQMTTTAVFFVASQQFSLLSISNPTPQYHFMMTGLIAGAVVYLINHQSLSSIMFNNLSFNSIQPLANTDFLLNIGYGLGGANSRFTIKIEDAGKTPFTGLRKIRVTIIVGNKIYVVIVVVPLDTVPLDDEKSPLLSSDDKHDRYDGNGKPDDEGTAGEGSQNPGSTGCLNSIYCVFACILNSCSEGNSGNSGSVNSPSDQTSSAAQMLMSLKYVFGRQPDQGYHYFPEMKQDASFVNPLLADPVSVGGAVY